MQRSYQDRFFPSAPGFLFGIGRPRVSMYTNSANSRAAVWKIATPANPSANTAFSYSVNGVVVSVTTDGSTSRTELNGQLLEATRNSDILNVAFVSQTSTGLTITAREAGVPLVVNAGVGLTPTNTVVAAIPSGIKFGLFVAESADGEARLPATDTDKLVGVTLSTYAIERNAVGSNAVTEYPPNEAMDVLDKNNDTHGIWVYCVESDLTTADDIYVVAGGADAGRVTRSDSGTISVPEYKAKIVKNAIPAINGGFMVGISLNYI